MNRRQHHIFTPARWLVVVTALVALYACDKTAPEDKTQEEPQAVAFSAYVNRGVATRAGSPGVLDNTSLQSAGFGVFGYHTVNALYSYTDEPGFMYNTKVTNPSGSAWTYSPIKYWPNQYGTGANSDLVDRVSFFAYAPHTEVDPATGELSSLDDGTPGNSRSTGIVRISRAIDKGSPEVTYRVSFDPGSSVDLCWGIPHMNIERPVSDVSTPVNFQFDHALAALNIQVDAAIDELSPGSNALASESRIYVA